MATTFDYRRENLRNIISANGGPGAVAKRLGYVNSSFLVQMTGPSPIRNVTESTARSFEQKLGIEPMSLDRPTDVPQTISAAQPMSNANLLELIQLVGRVCGDEKIDLPVAKYSDIIELSLLKPDEDHVRKLLSLLR